MPKLYLILVCAAVTTVTTAEPIESKVVGVDLFKNGLAVVREVVEVPGGGRHRLSSIPKPIHGTYWIESTRDVTVTMSQEEEEVANALNRDNMLSGMAGKTVTIYLKTLPDRTITGTVQDIVSDQFLVIDAGDVRTYVEKSDIGLIEVVEGAGEKGPVRTASKPALYFDVEGDEDEPTEIWISYLTRGITWAPSYRVDLSDSGELHLVQKAVIRNELRDLDDVELALISGFPNVEFSNVSSLLSPGNSMNDFFNQLRSGRPSDQPVMLQQVVTNNAFSNGSQLQSWSGDAQLPEFVSAQGVDMFLQRVGKRSLKKGDVLNLETESGAADYARLVRWDVPDQRREGGRRNFSEQDQAAHGQAWDVIRFNNPFTVPMTTGPASFWEDGVLRGQSLSYWVNPGAVTTLDVTKALSVETRVREWEVQGERDTVTINRTRYTRVQVKGTLDIRNHRAAAVTMAVRKPVTGKLVGKPKDAEVIPLGEAFSGANERGELRWTLELDGGESRQLTYTYEVLVRQ